MIKKIRKRDGNVVLFDRGKIADAVWKAVRSVGGHDRKRAEQISDLVVEKIEKENIESVIPEVEMCQILLRKL